MSIAGFLDDQRANFVLRWHARQTVRRETLAEHHFVVTRIALIVADALHYYTLAYPDIATVLLYALFHDAAEVETSDVSAEAKKLYPSLREAVELAESEVIDHVLFSGLPDWFAERYRGFARSLVLPLDTVEQQVVRYADKVAALKFAETELAIGNTLMRDAVVSIHAEIRDLDWPWLVQLRKETGLP